MANNKKGIGVGAAAAGLGAALATAAGAYWLYGAKDAAKHRRMARSWMLKARAEVMEAVEKVQNIDRKQYMAIVDKVAGSYAAMAGIARPEVERLSRDLRAAWNHMSAQMKSSGSAKKASPKRSAKKSAKKTSKK